MRKGVTLKLKIGPAIITIVADTFPEDDSLSSYRPFEYSGGESANLTLRIRTDPPPPRRNAPLIGELETQWQLYTQEGGQGGRRLEILEQISFQPKQVALINTTFDQVDLHLLQLTDQIPGYPRSGWYLEEIMFPFIQWWLTAWAALRREGMVLHGSAISLNGEGLAFVGPTGSGKTTVVRRCRDQAKGTVLNDERIFIWKSEGGFQVSGTPWHGELPKVSYMSVPFIRLCFLQKGKVNRFIPLSPVQSLTHLMPQAFLPIWSREGMEGLLEINTQLLKEVPSGELQFVNDSSVVDFIQELITVPHKKSTVEVR